MMEFKEKLQKIQFELKAPKSMTNSIVHYNYRSAEGILEAVKPLLQKYNLILTLSDEIVAIGEHKPIIWDRPVYDKYTKKDVQTSDVLGMQRIYVKATAILTDVESDGSIQVSSLARESEIKKAQDDSQMTGTSSSYARKYALNGLFLLDDTKDADTDEFQAASQKQEPKSNKPKDNDIVPTEDFKANDIITDKQKEQLKVLLTALNFKAESVFPKNPKLDLTQAEFGTALQTLRKIQESKGK